MWGALNIKPTRAPLGRAREETLSFYTWPAGHPLIYFAGILEPVLHKMIWNPRLHLAVLNATVCNSIKPKPSQEKNNSARRTTYLWRSRLLLLNSKQDEGREPSEATLGASLSSSTTDNMGATLVCNADGGSCSGFCSCSVSLRPVVSLGAAELSFVSRSSLLSFFGRDSSAAESLPIGVTFETSGFGGKANFWSFPPFSTTRTGPCFEALTPALTLCGSGSSMFKA